MGAVPSHGTTMGYVSDPFRTEEQGESDTRRGFARHAYAVPLAGFSRMNILDREKYNEYDRVPRMNLRFDQE